jgi:acyl-coenzyme A synthetase/AMP-(fatty) acid ligase
MSTVLDTAVSPVPRIPLLVRADPEAIFARHQGRDITQREFLEDAKALARLLPDRRYLINLCECSYHFLVAFAAAMLREQTNLLPSSRAELVVNEVAETWDGSHIVDDARVAAAIHQAIRHERFAVPLIDAEHLAVVGFTSGSTGHPRPHPKTWGGFAASTANNLAVLRGVIGDIAHFGVLATVPPQHMYGIEMSVLMPLLAGATLYTRRDLFPADIAASLAELPTPRILVTTPVHLRVLVEAGQAMPELAAVISATAPLSAELAGAVERRLHTTVLEVFGSTETCVIASRRTASECDWRLMPGVVLSPQPDGTLVQAPWFVQPTLLQDLIESLPEQRFRLCGRHSDQIEIAGKRASLADLTRRLQSLDGVQDAAVVQEDGDTGVRRLAALVVAPQRSVADIAAELRRCMDAAFVPRRIVLLDALPRNAVGKLPRQAVLDCLRQATMAKK